MCDAEKIGVEELENIAIFGFDGNIKMPLTPHSTEMFCDSRCHSMQSQSSSGQKTLDIPTRLQGVHNE